MRKSSWNWDCAEWDLGMKKLTWLGLIDILRRIVLGALVVITFAAGGLKWYMNRRRSVRFQDSRIWLIE